MGASDREQCLTGCICKLDNSFDRSLRGCSQSSSSVRGNLPDRREADCTGL